MKITQQEEIPVQAAKEHPSTFGPRHILLVALTLIFGFAVITYNVSLFSNVTSLGASCEGEAHTTPRYLRGMTYAITRGLALAGSTATSQDLSLHNQPTEPQLAFYQATPQCTHAQR